MLAVHLCEQLKSCTRRLQRIKTSAQYTYPLCSGTKLRIRCSHYVVQQQCTSGNAAHECTCQHEAHCAAPLKASVCCRCLSAGKRSASWTWTAATAAPALQLLLSYINGVCKQQPHSSALEWATPRGLGLCIPSTWRTHHCTQTLHLMMFLMHYW